MKRLPEELNLRGQTLHTLIRVPGAMKQELSTCWEVSATQAPEYTIEKASCANRESKKGSFGTVQAISSLVSNRREFTSRGH